MIYIVLRATIHESGNHIMNWDTLLGVYNKYSDAVIKAENYMKENKISDNDLFADDFYIKEYGKEKLDCGCCKEIYAHGSENYASGQKVSIFEVNIH